MSNTGDHPQPILQRSPTGQILVTLTNEQIASLSEEGTIQADVKPSALTASNQRTLTQQASKKVHLSGGYALENIDGRDNLQCVKGEKVETFSVHRQITELLAGTEEKYEDKSVPMKCEENIKTEDGRGVYMEDLLISPSDLYSQDVSTSSPQVLPGQDGATSSEEKVLNVVEGDTGGSPILSIESSDRATQREHNSIVLQHGQQNIEVRNMQFLIFSNFFLPVSTLIICIWPSQR